MLGPTNREGGDVKVLMRLLVGIAALAGLWWVVQMIAAESGEVVEVTTLDSAGAARTTRLWVVDYDGGQWLRAGGGIAGWFGRLSDRPEVEVERAGITAHYRAVPDRAQQGAINHLMREKYGWAERYIGFFIPRDGSIPIRLEPIVPQPRDG
jgi:hypothetical protein